MTNKLLLLEDVENVGQKGDIVTVKPGYARNYLLPQSKALLANKGIIKMQLRLQEERSKQAVIDKDESEAFAEKVQDIVLAIEVKVDPDGHMYGSVTSTEIVKLLAEKNLFCSRKSVQLPHPIKTTGEYKINLKLKEEVEASFFLHVNSEVGVKVSEQKAATLEEAKELEATEQQVAEEQEKEE